MTKKQLLFFGKVFISCIILFFLLKKIDFIRVASIFKHIKFEILLFLLITTILKLIIEIINWKMFLQINPEYRSNFREIIKSHFIGHSLRFLVPGGHGIIGKIYFVENKKKDTFLSLSVEKFFQIWLIIIFAVFASIFYFREINLYLKVVIFILVFSLPFLLILLRKIRFLKNFKTHILKYKIRIPVIVLLQIIYMLITVLQYFSILSSFA